MSETSYYVYALKDPRTSPAMPFYVGKGAGTRAYDHLVRPDQSRKGDRIREVIEAGYEVVVSRLCESLSEAQAIKLEAELISAFGTLETGGLLLNAIVPSGRAKGRNRNVTVPHGVREKAQIGLSLLKEAILEFAKANSSGITNSDCASVLGLHSDYGGGSKDYLSYSVLGLLMRDGRLKRAVGHKHVATVR